MAGSRRALIVANDSYVDPGLAGLNSAAADAQALGEVLSAPEIGDFQVEVSRNEPHYAVQARIEDFFVEAVAEDLLLLYFSGHGVKAETGELFLAAANTKPSRLASSAVPADFIQRCMRTTPSRSVVLFLDCCYGGAFPQGARVRAGGVVDVLGSFPAEGSRPGGRGRAVITSSNSMEYAFEGEQLSDSRARPSIFTGALVDGLRTGDADRDEDGLVSLDELYDYLYDQVRQLNPAQTPSRQFDLQGELHLAKSRRRRIKPAPLPAELAAALQDSNMFARLGALTELRRRLTSEDLTIAAAAHEALQQVSTHDIEQVAMVAAQAMAGQGLQLSPARLEAPAGPDGSTSRHRIELSGVPLARAVAVAVSGPEIRVDPQDKALLVTLHWPLPSSGLSITLQGPMGDTTIPIEVVPRPGAIVLPDEAEPVVLPTEMAEAAVLPGAAAPIGVGAMRTRTDVPAPAVPSADLVGAEPVPDGIDLVPDPIDLVPDPEPARGTSSPAVGTAAAPAEEPPGAATADPAPHLSRTLLNPVLSPLLYAAVSVWIALTGLAHNEFPSATGVAALGLAIAAVATVEWLWLTRHVLWTGALGGNGLLFGLLFLNMDQSTLVSYLIVGAIFNLVWLFVAARARRTVTGLGMLVLFLVLQVGDFLLTAVQVGTSDYDLANNIRHVDNYVELAISVICVVLPLNLLKSRLDGTTAIAASSSGR